MFVGAQTPRFQILSLDGGGIRGIFQAALLAQLEADLGGSVLSHFDLVVGTSTGGIIALGLGAGLSPAEMVEFYVAEQARIFPRSRRRHPALFRPKYGAAALEGALQRVFGDRLLAESGVPLVIPSFDLVESDVYLFKTPHHERLKRDYKVPMWAVAMATTAAPTYFPVFCLPVDRVRLVDGGVWANNPVVVGITEAVSMLERPLDEIRVLSLGTTAATKVRPSRLDRGGRIAWGVRGTPILDAFLDGQSAAAFGQAQHLVGVDDAIRLNPMAPKELISLDRCEAQALIAKAAHYSRKFAPIFAERFASHVASPFIPYHVDLQKAGVAC